MTTYKHVILGGGLAAGYAAQTFADHGNGHGITDNELCIISAESTLPYERPPLSKAFLADEKTKEEILINEPDFYEENGIVVKLDTRVTGVDFANQQLHTDTGETIGYEKLMIATGSQPRTFDVSGSQLDNIFYLRKIGDSKQIRQAADSAEQAIVIGGSFIGMEAASVLQDSGVATTLVFPEERVWDAFFTPEMSKFFEKTYRDRGVTILPNQEVTSFRGDHGRVTEIVTKSGHHLKADMVVAGIGVVPNSELFKDSDLQMKEGGLLVNRFLETNLPDVWAAGDITQYRDVLTDKVKHVEHWDNAVSQGQLAACGMLGERKVYEYVPYFFSDVFDLSYEFWGDTAEAEVAIHRGDVEAGEFSTWWLTEKGRLVAAFVLNRPDEERDLAPKWIKTGKRLSPTWLKDADSLQPAPDSEDLVPAY